MRSTRSPAPAHAPTDEPSALRVKIARACGAYALVGGAISFLGWVVDQPRLTDWLGTGISIQPNASLCVALSGWALLGLLSSKPQQAAVPAAVVTALAGATLLQWLTGLHFRIDSLLMFGREWGREYVSVPGRMGPPGSVSWTLIGTSLLLLLPRAAARRRHASTLALLSLGVGALSLIGYLYGASALFTLPSLTVIALQTATFVVAVSLGALAANPEHFPTRWLIEPGAAGMLARRATPAIVVLPLVFGWLELQGERLDQYDSPFGSALLVLCLMAALLAVLAGIVAGVHRTDAARRAAAARVTDILGSVTDPFYVVDAQFRVLIANDAARAFLGGSPSAVTGGSLWELIPDVLGTAAERELRRAASQAVAVEFERFEAAGQRWFVGRAYPTSDGGLAIYSRDVTEQRESARRVERAERRRQLALDAAGLGAWHVDLDRLVLVSDARFRAIFGVSAPELTYEQAVARIHPDDRERVHDAVAAATRDVDPLPYAIEYRVLLPDGSIRWVFAEGKKNAASEAATGLRGTFDGTLSDVTARHRAEYEREQLLARLRDADRRKDEFLATLAHELRNPLASVRMAAEVLARKPESSKDVRWASDVIERQSRHLSRLIDDLLDLSRITRGQIELRPESLDLAAVLREALESLAPLLQHAHGRVQLDTPEEPIMVSGDRTRLVQVFANLLQNALKYSDAGAPISVHARRHGPSAVVRVCDRGIGIAADMLPRVFEMFLQVEATADRGRGGLGIGLTLVKQLVEAHGGQIAARSEGVGLGSEFCVTLPCGTPEPLQGGTSPPSVAAPRRMDALILIVEDNPDAAESLRLLLEIEGYRTRVAHDGVTAVQLATELRPTAILLDIGLPGQDGLAVARAIRAQDWGRTTLIVAVTGRGHDQDRDQSRDAGFDHHLTKPVASETLLSLLRRADGVQPDAFQAPEARPPL